METSLVIGILELNCNSFWGAQCIVALKLSKQTHAFVCAVPDKFMDGDSYSWNKDQAFFREWVDVVLLPITFLYNFQCPPQVKYLKSCQPSITWNSWRMAKNRKLSICAVFPRFFPRSRISFLCHSGTALTHSNAKQTLDYKVVIILTKSVHHFKGNVSWSVMQRFLALWNFI